MLAVANHQHALPPRRPTTNSNPLVGGSMVRNETVPSSFLREATALHARIQPLAEIEDGSRPRVPHGDIAQGSFMVPNYISRGLVAGGSDGTVNRELAIARPASELRFEADP